VLGKSVPELSKQAVPGLSKPALVLARKLELVHKLAELEPSRLELVEPSKQEPVPRKLGRPVEGLVHCSSLLVPSKSGHHRLVALAVRSSGRQVQELMRKLEQPGRQELVGLSKSGHRRLLVHSSGKPVPGLVRKLELVRRKLVELEPSRQELVGRHN